MTYNFFGNNIEIKLQLFFSYLSENSGANY
jgi:hypothetical protein